MDLPEIATASDGPNTYRGTELAKRCMTWDVWPHNKP